MTMSSRWISQDDVYTPMTMGVIINARYHRNINVSHGITGTLRISTVSLHESAKVKGMASIVYVAFYLQDTLNMNEIVSCMQ